MYVVYLWYQSLMIQGHVSRAQAFVHKTFESNNGNLIVLLGNGRSHQIFSYF
jgi:hypothetical protein